MVFEYDDAIHQILLTCRTLRKGCYCISIFFAFSSGRAKSIRIRYVKKNLISQKHPDTCGRDLNLTPFDVLIEPNS